MFSGIVEELGEVIRIQRVDRNTHLEIKADKVCLDVKQGESIAVNGVCLTLTKECNGILVFQVMPQTLQATNLGILRVRDRVNLESSLRLGDRISGHFVYGHIDCVGVIRSRTIVNDNLCFDIAIPPNFIPMVFLNGSIAVDGISLTVQNKKGNSLSVYIIPHTLKNTTLGLKKPSDKVNIEIDKLGASLSYCKLK